MNIVNEASELADVTPALLRLAIDANLAGMLLTRGGSHVDIHQTGGLDTEGQPLWGARIFLTERSTFLAAKHFVGPHVTTVHTIGEIRRLLFEE